MARYRGHSAGQRFSCNFRRLASSGTAPSLNGGRSIHVNNPKFKLAPSPARSIAGTLSQTGPVLQALGVETRAATMCGNHRKFGRRAGDRRGAAAG